MPPRPDPTSAAGSGSFLALARSEHAAPLALLGAVSAPGPEQAGQAAIAAYGDSWLELVVIPTDRVRWVITEDPAGEEEGAA